MVLSHFKMIFLKSQQKKPSLSETKKQVDGICDDVYTLIDRLNVGKLNFLGDCLIRHPYQDYKNSSSSKDTFAIPVKGNDNSAHLTPPDEEDSNTHEDVIVPVDNNSKKHASSGND